MLAGLCLSDGKIRLLNWENLPPGSETASPPMQTLLDLSLPRTLGDSAMAKLSENVKTAEAVEIFGVAQNTLRKWAERGDSHSC